MVRVSVPCTGRASRIMPAPIASTAEISDHQKPGICRAQNVSARPAMPLIRNIQPRKMVTARLASGGTIIAANPRITKQNALNQKRLPMLANRGGHSRLQIGGVLGKGHWNSPDAALRNALNYSVRKRRTVKYVRSAPVERNQGLPQLTPLGLEAQPQLGADEKPCAVVRIRSRPRK